MPEAPEGIEEVEVPLDQPIEGQAEQSLEPFLEVDLDGEKLTFSDKDQALKHLREGTLRHSDYTRKTQEVAEQRKQVEAKEKEIESQLSHFLQMKGQYDKIDNFMKQRPDVRDYILSQMRNPDPRRQMDSVKEYADEKTKTLEEEIKSLREKYEADEQAKTYERQREEVFSELSSKYEDFDKKGITNMLAEIESYQSLPPKEAMRNFAEILYYARKGKESPVQREERQARAVSRPMQSSVKPIEAKGSLSGDMDEIAFKLKKDAGLA